MLEEEKEGGEERKYGSVYGASNFLTQSTVFNQMKSTLMDDDDEDDDEYSNNEVQVQ